MMADGSYGVTRRLLFVTKSFPPVRHSGTIRSEAFCHHLPRFGIDPVVLTCSNAATHEAKRQDYLQSQDDAGEFSVIRLPWSNRSHRNTIFNGYWNRIPVAGTISANKGRREMVARIRAATADMRQIDSVDCVLATVPPGDSAVLGAALAQQLCIPLVIDLRDPWSHWPMPLYNHYLDFLLERSMESRVLRQAACVTVTTKASKELLLRKFDIAASRVRVISNGYNEDDFSRASTSQNDVGKKFVITYTGSINDHQRATFRQRIVKRLGFNYDPLQTNYNARSAYFFLQALSQLIAAKPDLRHEVRVQLVGTPEDRLNRTLASFPHKEMLRVLPRVSEQEATRLICQSDLLLLTQLETYLDGKEFCVAVPGKLYSYLRSGKRILACVQASENSEIIKEFDAGESVHPRDVPGIAAAVEAEIELWKSRTRSDVLRPNSLEGLARYERSNQAQQLAGLIHELVPEAACR